VHSTTLGLDWTSWYNWLRILYITYTVAIKRQLTLQYRMISRGHNGT